MVPYRDMGPWWENPTVWAPPSPTFRMDHLGAQWNAAPPGGDPARTANGDIARAGTIPQYVPYALLHPGMIGTTPQ